MPPSNETEEKTSGAIILVATMYGLCVSCGLIGNATVIIMVLRVLKNSKRIIHVYLYVLCLSATDFIYMLTGPFIIVYMLTDDWIFGQVICKMTFAFEGLNKTLSVYLLVILSVDRYMAICHPTTSAKYRTVKFAVRILLCILPIVIASNIPLCLFASVQSCSFDMCRRQCLLAFPQFIDFQYINYSSIGPWYKFEAYYTLFFLIFYFIFPAVLITFFYTETLTQINRQYAQTERRVGRRRKVAKSVAWVVLFYFCCWTPYWLLQTLIQFFPVADVFGPAFIIASTVVYALPYINSSVNPILYAFLNKSLTEAYARAMKHKNDRVLQADEDFEDISGFRSRVRSVSRWFNSRNSFRLSQDPSAEGSPSGHQPILRTRSSTMSKPVETYLTVTNGHLDTGRRRSYSCDIKKNCGTKL